MDAKPAKSFDGESNKFKCSQCQKNFRKESLLSSHIKYYHEALQGKDLSAPVREIARRQTISVCKFQKDLLGIINNSVILTISIRELMTPVGYHTGHPVSSQDFFVM